MIDLVTEMKREESKFNGRIGQASPNLPAATKVCFICGEYLHSWQGDSWHRKVCASCIDEFPRMKRKSK